MTDHSPTDNLGDTKIRSAKVEPNNKTTRSRKRGKNIKLIIAIITVIGTVAAAVITASGQVFATMIAHPLPTNVAAMTAVSTVTEPMKPNPTNEPKETQAPRVIPTATFTPQSATVTSPPAREGEFESGCISIDRWTPSRPASYESGCYRLESDGFLTLKGQGLNLSQDLPNEGLLAIYTPIKDRSQVRFNVSLTKLWGSKPKHPAYLLMGIGRKDNWFREGQFLWIGSDPSRQVSLTTSTLYPWQVNPSQTNLPFDAHYEVNFSLVGKNVQIDVGDFHKTLALDANSLAKPVFLIGMAAPQGGSVDTIISNFEIIPIP